MGSLEFKYDDFDGGRAKAGLTRMVNILVFFAKLILNQMIDVAKICQS